MRIFRTKIHGVSLNKLHSRRFKYRRSEMARPISRLVKYAAAQLMKQQQQISYTSLSVEIVLKHQPVCQHWQTLATEQLVMLVYYCLYNLNMSDFRCETITILQQYLSKSGNIFPQTEQQLADFYHNGMVPLNNLHLLSKTILAQTSSCAMCVVPLSPGTTVFVLSCGHHCCGSPNSRRCDVRDWLSSTNTCPDCLSILHCRDKSMCDV